MRLVLTGGGTGGHVYPALALAEHMRKYAPGTEILYIGSEGGLEGDILSKTDIPFESVKVRGLPRKVNRELLEAGGEALLGLRQARGVLQNFKPDLVIGTGGFVAGPVVLAACLLGIPSMIHEQNAFPGLTNRLLAPMVKRVLLNFPQAQVHFRGPVHTEVVGLPVRGDIGRLTKEDACARYGLDPERPVLLATGGSRGARTINRVLAMAIGQILKRHDLQILFITGKERYSETSLLLRECGIQPSEIEDLVLLDYVYDMPSALGAADFVLGRAGATFLAEIAAAGLPGILVPYPFAADNHQHFNAQAVADAGAALAIADQEFTVPVLLEALEPFVRDVDYRRDKAEAMAALARPDVLEHIASIVEDLLEQSVEKKHRFLRR